MIEFENPLVETEYSILHRFKSHFIKNNDIYVFDLGEKIRIYSPHINSKTNIEHYQAKDFLNNHLLNITNAYKQFNPKIIEKMLNDDALKVQNISKGNMLPDKYLKYSIENAQINNDTIDVDLNSSIRFITNPFYKWKEGEFDNRKHLKRKLVNKFLGNEKVNINYKTIYNCICDHDCYYGKISIKSLSKDANLSKRTIQNYLKSYPILCDLYIQVSILSKTEMQRTNNKYYNNKLVKRAS